MAKSLKQQLQEQQGQQPPAGGEATIEAGAENGGEENDKPDAEIIDGNEMMDSQADEPVKAEADEVPTPGTSKAAKAVLAPMPDVVNGPAGAKMLDRALTSGANG
jgi:hypothetical protein